MKDTKANCTEVRDRLPLFVGGDLEADALEFVGAHVAECGECGQEAAAAARAREVFRSAVSLSVAQPVNERDGDSGLWTGIRSSLVAEGILTPAQRSTPLTSSATRPRLVLLRRASGFAAAAAVLVAALVFGPGLFENGVTRDGADPAVAIVEGAGTLAVETPIVAHPNERMLERRLPSEKALADEAMLLKLQPIGPMGPGGPNSLAGHSASTGRRRLR